MHVCPDEVFVCQIQPGGGDGSGDHERGDAEEMLVVRAALGAVGDDQSRLPGTSGAAATLGVVGWGRWNVAHGHGVQLGDIHSQFHGGRAIKDWELRLSEGVLTPFTFFACNLGGMLLGFQVGAVLDRAPV